MDDVDKENKTKKKKKKVPVPAKVPVGGFQEEVCDKGFTVEVKAEMDDVDKENKTKKKKNKTKIGQGNDSVNGTAKKRKIDQEQSQPFPRVDQYLNERALKNAERKRKIAEEGDKGNNKKRKLDTQVDIQKNGDEVQKKCGKKGKQNVSADQGKQDVSTYHEANVKEDVPVKGFQEEVCDEGFTEGNVSTGAKLDSEGDIQNKNGDEVQKKWGKKGKQTVSTDQGKQDVSTYDEKADHGKKGKQDVSTGKEGKETVSTYHEAEEQEGNASTGAKLDSEGDVKKKNGDEVEKNMEKKENRL